jgi:hypothetical protein
MRVRVHSASPVGALEWGTWASQTAFYHGSSLEHQTEISLNHDLPYTPAQQRNIPSRFCERIRCTDRAHQSKGDDGDGPAHPHLRTVSSAGFNRQSRDDGCWRESCECE